MSHHNPLVLKKVFGRSYRTGRKAGLPTSLCLRAAAHSVIFRWNTPYGNVQR